MLLPDRLKKIRKDLGYSQTEMADHFDMILKTYQRCEQGKALPSIMFLEELAKQGYNIHWVVTGAGPMRIGEGGIQEGGETDTNADSISQSQQQRRHAEELPINEQLIPINEWLAELPLMDRVDFLSSFRATYPDFERFWQEKKEGKTTTILKRARIQKHREKEK